MGIRKAIRNLLDKFYKPFLLNYTRRDRRYRYESLDLLVKAGIFHPKFFNSTTNLLTFLKKLELGGKSLLDLGTGSGIIALYAASKGAIVTASDINPQAIENTAQNSRDNHIDITIIKSDLFDHIKGQKYEIIAINPPYYPKNPEIESDYAWYCGEGFEYYHKLFEQLPACLNPNSVTVISLADTCDIYKIQHIAHIYDFELDLIEQKNYLWEKQLIFKIIKK